MSTRGCGASLTPNPKDHEIAAGYQKYAEHGCDVLVAVGGGSVIDAAKGVAILAANGGDILDYEGVDKARLPIPPLVVVPSTSGTGADVSQFCIVTDTTRNTKITILGRALVPDITVIDPRLLTTMPEWLNAATGLDALTHGIEAFVSLGHNQLTDHHALRAVQMVTDNLVDTIERPDGDGAPRADGPGRARSRSGVHQRDPRCRARDEPSGRRACSTCRTASSTGCCCPTSSGSTPTPIRSRTRSSPPAWVCRHPGAPAAEAALALAERIERLARRRGRAARPG